MAGRGEQQLATLRRDGRVPVTGHAEKNALIDACLAEQAAKQFTAEELAAEREGLSQQEPGEENARAEEALRQRGIDFEAARAAFNRGDHGDVERFLRSLTPAAGSAAHRGPPPVQR